MCDPETLTALGFGEAEVALLDDRTDGAEWRASGSVAGTSGPAVAWPWAIDRIASLGVE